jgi:hypothetical protein
MQKKTNLFQDLEIKSIIVKNYMREQNVKRYL